VPGLSTVVLGGRELDQLGILQHLSEVPSPDVKSLTRLDRQMLSAREPVQQMALDQIAPVLAGAHVIGQAAVEGRRVESSWDQVPGTDHLAKIERLRLEVADAADLCLLPAHGRILARIEKGDARSVTEIRKATERDSRAIAALWTEAYVTLGVGGRVDPYTEDDFADSSRHGHVFVVDGEAGVLGVVVLFAPGARGRVVGGPGEAELSRLAVAASARRNGIGRALTAFCEEQARAAGWSAIVLWSRPGQEEAHRLYESLGYRRVPRRDSIDATGHGRLVFRLAL